MDKIELFKKKIPPDKWVDGSFSFINLIISLGDTANIDDLYRDRENATCFVTLIHEYIHYIQCFTTTSGFIVFITYLDLVLSFFGANSSLPKNPSTPTRKGVVDISFGKKNFHNFLKYLDLGTTFKDDHIVFATTSEKNFSLIEKSILNPYNGENIYISYLAYNGKLIPLNELIVSENMAMMASYISSDLLYCDVKKTINVVFDAQYHIIFAFISNLFPSKNCLKLTYIISEISMLLLPLNRTISEIIKFIKKEKKSLEVLSEDEILHKIKIKLNFDKLYKLLLNKSNEQLGQRIEILTKHKKDFEFFNHIVDIIQVFKSGLSERTKTTFTYRDKLDFSFLEHFVNIIKSPLIVFSKEKPTALGKHSKIFLNSLATFSGVFTVFFETYYNSIKKCPFLNVHYICGHKKGVECSKDPFSIYKIKKYEGCLFYNSLYILGLKKLGRVST